MSSDVSVVVQVVNEKHNVMLLVAVSGCCQASRASGMLFQLGQHLKLCMHVMYCMFVFMQRNREMAETGDSKKEEADYKRLHSFPLIRVSAYVCVSLCKEREREHV